MAINLVTKYASQVLERFKHKSVTEGYFNREYDAEFIGAKTVKIHSVNTVPMNDYARTGANRYGTPTELEDTVQEHSITRDRSFTYTIDKGNNIQQNFIKSAGKTLKRQIDEVVVPEVDVYRFEQMDLKVPATNKLELDLATESAYDKFLDLQEKLDDEFVPENGRVMWATPELIKVLKKDPNFVLPTETGQSIKFKGFQGEIDGVDIIKAPKKWLPENVMGILAHPIALASPLQLSEYQIHQDPPGISGHLVEGRMIYDTFVFDGREVALGEIVKKVTP